MTPGAKIQTTDRCQECDCTITRNVIEHAFCPTCRYALTGKRSDPDTASRYEILLDETPTPEAKPIEQDGDIATAKRILIYVTGGKFDLENFGSKAAQIAFLSGCFPGMTQDEFAKKLGVTPGRISQMIKAVRAWFSEVKRPDDPLKN